MTVLKGIAEIEMLALNSRESFEDNKQFLRTRLEQEDNPAIRKLLEKTRIIWTGSRLRWRRPGSL